jgi:hypothetical protein
MAQSGRRKTDQALIVALSCGATVENAARQVGVSERTVFRRLKDPEFQERVAAATQDMVLRTTNMLTAASLESVKTLLRLQGQGVPYSVQLGAARAVVDLATKLREHADLSERVAALEKQLTGAA